MSSRYRNESQLNKSLSSVKSSPAVGERRSLGGRNGLSASVRKVASPQHSRLDISGLSAASSSPQVKSQLKELEQERDRLEKQGKYLKAAELHEKMIDLKVSEEARRKDDLQANRMAYLRNLESTFEQETATLAQKWDQMFADFEARVEQGRSDLRKKHEQAIQEYRSKMEKDTTDDKFLSRNFPPSKRLLEMRKAERGLAHNKDYLGANHMKNTADAFEKQEFAERKARARLHAEMGLDKVRDKLQQELDLFEGKCEATRAMMVTHRRQEETNLYNRFHNKKTDLALSTSKVEGLIDKKIEHLSPAKTKGRRSLQSPFE